MRRDVLVYSWLLILSVLLLACGDDDEPGMPSNHSPIIQAQADTSTAIGDTLRIRAVADDADGDPLSYGVVASLTMQEILMGYRPNAEIDHDTGDFRFISQLADQPNRAFMFRVLDGRGGADSTQFTITVN
jgi:hypothetical protein